MLQDEGIGLWPDRELMLIVVDEERACFEGQSQFLPSARCRIGLPGPGSAPCTEVLLDRRPVDIEGGGIGRARTVFEHIHPPSVARTLDAHMIRHDVEYLTQAVTFKLGDHGVIIFGPDLDSAWRGPRYHSRADSRFCRKVRRCVDVRDAQLMEVGMIRVSRRGT